VNSFRLSEISLPNVNDRTAGLIQRAKGKEPQNSRIDDMKVSYDETTDTLSVILQDNTPVAESDEDKPGVILDYDATGNLVSLEILDASKRVTETRKVEFQTTG
jgi:uncharacterized protein YuzE